MSWWVQPTSTDEVALSQVLRALVLGGLDRDGTTELTVDEALAVAGVDNIGAFFAIGRLAHDDQLFRTDTLTSGSGDEHLAVTLTGRQLPAEFSNSAIGSVRRPIARIRLMKWLEEKGGNGSPADMEYSLLAWFYGAKFNFCELSDCGRYLSKEGLIQGLFADGGDLVHARIKPDGNICLERFAGDIQAMQNHAHLGVNIEYLDNKSNLSIGGDGGTQNTSTGNSYLLSLSDLALVLQKISIGSSRIGNHIMKEAAELEHEIVHIGDADRVDLSTLNRVAALFHHAADSLKDETVASAALTALAHIISNNQKVTDDA